MTWTQKIIGREELMPFAEGRGERGLCLEVAALMEQQKQTWPLLREGYSALAEVETKPVRVDESEILIQHNPRRMVSTGARVDKAAVDNRRCFLCPDSLPPEEKGIAYDNNLVILCNPFPVLDKHLSIVHRQHIEQKIDGNVGVLLALARDLSPGYFVLYNGPECGASAPDHLHFQACSRELLPIERLVLKEELPHGEQCEACAEMPRDEFELFTLGDAGRTVAVFRSNNEGELERWVYETLAALARETDRSEAMVNIICTHAAGKWTVYLFPRLSHRPACFFAEGDRRLMVSPGAIDMAGLVVVPRREDYEKIDVRAVEQIFSEVSLDETAVNGLIEDLCARLGEDAQW